MYVAEMQDGEVRVLRTIAISIFVLCAMLVPPAQSQSWKLDIVLASHSVQSEVGTYKKTTQRLMKSLSDINLESSSYVYRSRYNGFNDRKHYNRHRDTALVIPTDARPEDLTLIVWFHGLNGFSEKTFTRVFNQVKELTDEGHSIAVSIPEMPWSINTSTKRSRQGRIWEYPGDFANFIAENKDKLEQWAQSTHNMSVQQLRIIIVGHSAGGSAISSAAQEGGLCEVRPSNIVWSDASYGQWLNNAWNGCLSDAKAKVKLLVRKWDKPHVRASNFLKSIGNSSDIDDRIDYEVLDRKQYKHGDIGNNALILSDLFEPGC
jgi:hypothetical protein